MHLRLRIEYSEEIVWKERRDASGPVGRGDLGWLVTIGRISSLRFRSVRLDTCDDDAANLQNWNDVGWEDLETHMILVHQRRARKGKEARVVFWKRPEGITFQADGHACSIT